MKNDIGVTQVSTHKFQYSPETTTIRQRVLELLKGRKGLTFDEIFYIIKPKIPAIDDMPTKTVGGRKIIRADRVKMVNRLIKTYKEDCFIVDRLLGRTLNEMSSVGRIEVTVKNSGDIYRLIEVKE